MFKNQIVLSGKALKDSERKGNGPWKFTIVQGGGRKKDSDERWPKEFFNCEAWPDVQGAEQVKAGEVIMIEGRLKQREWSDSSGEKKRGYSIQCSIVRPREDEPKSTPVPPNSGQIQDSDIPF